MNTASYQALVASLNGALVTAGVSTLTFTAVANVTLNSTLYPNLIDYIGYILDSDSLKVNSIITAELTKYGQFSVVKSTARAVTPPSPPANDHYITYNGYYVSNSDLPQGEVQFSQFKSDIEGATKGLSTTIQNKAKPIGWNTTSQSATVNVADVNPTTKTVTSTVTVTINKT